MAKPGNKTTQRKKHRNERDLKGTSPSRPAAVGQRCDRLDRNRNSPGAGQPFAVTIEDEQREAPAQDIEARRHAILPVEDLAEAVARPKRDHSHPQRRSTIRHALAAMLSATFRRQSKSTDLSRGGPSGVYASLFRWQR